MQLLIQFFDAELDQFRWSACDEQSLTLELDWQDGSEAEMSLIAAQNPYPVILLIPQQCVYLTEVALPEKIGRQILSAIEFQIEDQLAQDIETQHFALGDTSQNPIAIAVIEKTIMARCLMLTHSHGLRLAQIIPEVFLCPASEGVSLTAGYDGWLIRYGSYRGLKCNAAALPAMLKLIGRDREFDRIQCFVTAAEELPEIEGISFERVSLDSSAPGFVDSPFIDLQQREYQKSSRWKELGTAWKWIGILLAALLAVGAYNKAIALNQLEAELEDIKQQQYQLLKPHLPASTTADADLKKMLIERMKQLQASEGEQGFLQLMADFTRARSKYPQITITRVGYQNQRLNIDLSDQKLQNIEALHSSLKQKGVSAELENLSIKPELISARLVLQGGEDG